jgi:CO/xanthine dehydrogenase Mo-binding subunit
LLVKLQAGAFPGSPVMNACLCAFAPYAIDNARSVGYDVVCNRPKSAAYRAPGSPISAFAVESVIDMLAKKIGMDPAELRRKNAAGPGTPMIYGPKLAHGGYRETLEAIINHPDYKKPLGPNQGRGVASGYWFNGGGESSATVQINADGTILVATGSPDIGGSRASMAIMAAETFGVDYSQVRAIVADTASVGYTHVTGGSRVTFATGMAVVDASKKLVDDLRARAAMIWDVDVEGVIWENGHAKPASSNVGDFKFGQLTEACIAAAKRQAKPAQTPRATWIPAEFLEAQQVAPWSEMPAWLPAKGEEAAFASTSNAAARAKGFVDIPVEVEFVG